MLIPLSPGASSIQLERAMHKNSSFSIHHELLKMRHWIFNGGSFFWMPIFIGSTQLFKAYVSCSRVEQSEGFVSLGLYCCVCLHECVETFFLGKGVAVKQVLSFVLWSSYAIPCVLFSDKETSSGRWASGWKETLFVCFSHWLPPLALWTPHCPIKDTQPREII